jgi:hypothetical protein
LNIGWRQRRTMAISGVAGSRVYPAADATEPSSQD